MKPWRTSNYAPRQEQSLACLLKVQVEYLKQRVGNLSLFDVLPYWSLKEKWTVFKYANKRRKNSTAEETIPNTSSVRDDVT